MSFIVIVLAMVLAGVILFHYISHKIRQYTGGLLDPSNISALKNELERDAAERPKSVSAMTGVYLPKIAADFPDFNYPEMKKRAETVLVSYLRAIDANDRSALSGGGYELKESLGTYLDMLAEQGIHENFDLINIHRTEISGYTKEPGRCIITFQSSLECIHNKLKDGKLIEGSEELKYQTRYETDMVYIQDRDKVESDSNSALGYNCPNCGAPIKSLKYKSCEYCGAGIQEYNIKVWTFTAIRSI